MHKEFVSQILGSLIEGDKIKVPKWAKKIKIDVGTSSNAPFSEFWINSDPDVCVFAFEPNIYNIHDLVHGFSGNPNKLNTDKIDKSFFIINCALSNFVSESVDFYCADIDGGTSSLFQPKTSEIPIKQVTKVPVIKLENFFSIFPWESFEFIEQVKIDAQSSDFAIIKGMGNYLKDKIAYIDVETSTEGQYDNIENADELKSYLIEQGFECVKWGLDATFFNKKFEAHKKSINYCTLH